MYVITGAMENTGGAITEKLLSTAAGEGGVFDFEFRAWRFFR
jgi:hypothetical protein